MQINLSHLYTLQSINPLPQLSIRTSNAMGRISTLNPFADILPSGTDTGLSSWQGEITAAEKLRWLCARCEKSAMSDTGGHCKIGISWGSIMQGNTSVTGEDGKPCKNGERLWFNFSTTIKRLESDSKAGERKVDPGRAGASEECVQCCSVLWSQCWASRPGPAFK